KRAFAYLQYGLYQSEGFIVITGEIGAGKTTIVRSLFEQIDRDKLVAAQLVSTQLDADDMLRAVGAAFGLPVRAVGKAVLLASLDRTETQAYIEHRLHHVGWNEDPRFEPSCFDLIHTWSGGIPRRINTLCNRLMLAGFLGEKHVIVPADVQAIAREIRDEMGPDATLGPAPLVA